VRNGTGASRQGAEATAALQAVGFNATVSGDELGAGAGGTVIRYRPDQSAAADLVARWLVSGARLEPTASATGIELVTGTDWQGVRESAAPSTSTTTQATLPAPTSTTSTTSPTEGQTTTSLDLASFDC
jgi:LytR cell envelope-related transcriptional attenuator